MKIPATTTVYKSKHLKIGLIVDKKDAICSLKLLSL